MEALLVVVAGLVIAAIVYLATSGHVVFLPIMLVLPLASFDMLAANCHRPDA
jgi:hypothetical protein